MTSPQHFCFIGHFIWNSEWNILYITSELSNTVKQIKKKTAQKKIFEKKLGFTSGELTLFDFVKYESFKPHQLPPRVHTVNNLWNIIVDTTCWIVERRWESRSNNYILNFSYSILIIGVLYANCLKAFFLV